MRKIFAILLFAVCISGYAQEVVPFALTKQNARATYRVVYEKKGSNKVLSYYNIAVNSVTKGDDGTKMVVYRTDFLYEEKQKSILHKRYGGSKGGFFNQIMLAADGSYAMDQDMDFGYGEEMARSGFMFKIPNKLTVGQTLESSTVNQKYVSHQNGAKLENIISLAYNNVKVDREEDYETLAGIFHCYVITYNISGSIILSDFIQSFPYNINQSVTMWVAPGIGVVCYKVYSISPEIDAMCAYPVGMLTTALMDKFPCKKQKLPLVPVYVELCELEGM